MSKHVQLVQEAKQAIAALLADNSVSPAQKKEALDDLIEEMMEKSDALGE